MSVTRTLILDSHKISQKINRIAWQIYEHYYKEDEIILSGIVDNGYILAQRIAKVLEEISPIKVSTVKISLNKTSPLSEAVITELKSEDVENKVVIVVDDVLDSGKTLIYGVKHFLNFPIKHLKTVVLVDRSHRIFPVRADYVGLTLATTLQEQIRVEFHGNGEDGVYLQ
ncbi:MAG: phosphoribosyltransferase [Bacteroidetes bacterium]|nr:phosphoribosyltransferase [Bacteroidota bacterium]HET6243554.1 phosphoribosyltransferase family protein [Bacteroidia bacterium]